MLNLSVLLLLDLTEMETLAETIVLYFPKKTILKKCKSSRALALKKLSKPSDIQLNTACSLVYPWGKKLLALDGGLLTPARGDRSLSRTTGIKPALIIESNVTSWQIDSLNHEPDDCIQWNKSRCKLKKLVVSSFDAIGTLQRNL